MEIYEIDGLRLYSGQPKRWDHQKVIAMSNQKVRSKTEKELQEIILQEKAKGTPDIEIGQKYGVTFRYIERLITKSKGINVSALKVSKKIKTLYPKDFKEETTTVFGVR